MIGVEDDHLGRTTRLAARLDRSRRRVRAAHERDRTRRGTAAFESFGARANLGEVDTRTRAALEDDALFGVPIEDRAHRVLDGEDEARAALLGHALHADVEPDRRVEGGLLRDEQVFQFGAEDLGLFVVDEVVGVDRPTS